MCGSHTKTGREVRDMKGDDRRRMGHHCHRSVNMMASMETTGPGKWSKTEMFVFLFYFFIF